MHDFENLWPGLHLVESKSGQTLVKMESYKLVYYGFFYCCPHSGPKPIPHKNKGLFGAVSPPGRVWFETAMMGAFGFRVDVGYALTRFRLVSTPHMRRHLSAYIILMAR